MIYRDQNKVTPRPITRKAMDSICGYRSQKGFIWVETKTRPELRESTDNS